MNGSRWTRLGAKVLHDIASISFGGGLAACLVINLTANRASASEFASARQVLAAIAEYVLIPSMAVVVVSGLIAMMATRGYQDAGWAWVKAVLGISVFVATVRLVGASSKQAELVAAVTDPGMLDAMLAKRAQYAVATHCALRGECRARRVAAEDDDQSLIKRLQSDIEDGTQPRSASAILRWTGVNMSHPTPSATPKKWRAERVAALGDPQAASNEGKVAVIRHDRHAVSTNGDGSGVARSEVPSLADHLK